MPEVIRPQNRAFLASVWKLPGLTTDEVRRIDEGKAFLHLFGTIHWMTYTNEDLSWPFWYIWKPFLESFDGLPTLWQWEHRTHRDTPK